MRDPNRIYDYAARLTGLWRYYPELRFSQFITWLDSLYQKITERDPFFAEDEEYFKVIETYLYEKLT